MADIIEDPFVPQFTPSSFEQIIPCYQFEFVKSLLFRIYSMQLEYPDCKVIRMTGKSDNTIDKPKLIAISLESDTGFYRVGDNILNVTLSFLGFLYEIALYVDSKPYGVHFYLFILGLEPSAKRVTELARFLKSEALIQSPYRNRLLLSHPTKSQMYDECGEIFLSALENSNDRLEDIFLPDGLMDRISLFTQCLVNYPTSKKSLRYLFSGKPGTGKTKLIRAIANACAGKATFIFTNGNEKRLESLFELVDLFCPVVLCIDDIDLMAGSREEAFNTPRLALFLQKLDGFVRQDFFLLATTNDKSMVDIAASRPGRFDLVMDVSLVCPQDYLSLVKSKTQRREIIDLFDSDILSILEAKKTTGAFIANLVKHLEIVSEFDPKNLTREYLRSTVTDDHQGFYEKPVPTNGKAGFQMT